MDLLADAQLLSVRKPNLDSEERYVCPASAAQIVLAPPSSIAVDALNGFVRWLRPIARAARDTMDVREAATVASPLTGAR